MKYMLSLHEKVYTSSPMIKKGWGPSLKIKKINIKMSQIFINYSNKKNKTDSIEIADGMKCISMLGSFNGQFGSIIFVIC
jgi:hypothetical protein